MSDRTHGIRRAATATTSPTTFTTSSSPMAMAMTMAQRADTTGEGADALTHSEEHPERIGRSLVGLGRRAGVSKAAVTICSMVRSDEVVPSPDG